MSHSVYPDEPSTSTVLTIKEIKKVLNDHSIQYSTDLKGNPIMLDSYTVNGELFEEWVLVKKTYGELIKWLGY